MPEDRPGKGFMGWLGRQVGYVAKAVRTDVEVVAKKRTVEERESSQTPGLTYRRTTIDEVRRKPETNPRPPEGDRG